MEMIAAVIFALMMFFCMGFCLFSGLNITINVHHKYKYPEVIRLNDPFDPEGNPKTDFEKTTIDDIVKAVNNIILDKEDE